MPDKYGRGRPTIITEKLVARLCKAIMLGASYQMACNFAGVHPTTFERWMRTAEAVLREVGDQASLADMILPHDDDGNPLVELTGGHGQAERRLAATVPASFINSPGFNPDFKHEHDQPVEWTSEDADDNLDPGAQPDVASILTDYQRRCLWVWHMVSQAEARCTTQMLQNIQNASNRGEWQAGAWLLERRYPDTYGRRTRIENTGPEGGPQQVEHTVKVYIPDNGRQDTIQLAAGQTPAQLPATNNANIEAIDAEYESIEEDDH